MTVLITLTIAGTDTGPFNLYSNADGFVSTFETGVSKAALQAGYSSALVPNSATVIRVKSVGNCTNYIDIPLGITTTTTTTQLPCKNYTLTKMSCMKTIATVNYLDCYGSVQEASVYDSGPLSVTFCALQGSVTGVDLTNGCATLTYEGDCPTPTTTTTTTTATPTTTTSTTTVTPTTTTTTTIEITTTTTTTTVAPVSCTDWYNNSGSPQTVTYTDCNGILHTDYVILYGQSVCAQNGSISGPGFGSLIDNGPCIL